MPPPLQPQSGYGVGDFIGDFGPSIVAGGLNLAGQERANVQNLRIAREQMAFQERMSSSSWQRAVSDMKLAGINPMLAYMKGGASSPAGAQARMENVMAPAVSSAMHAKRLQKELRIMDEQAKNIVQDTGKKQAEANLLKVRQLIESWGTPIPGLTASGKGGMIPYGVHQRQAQLRLTQAQLEALNRILPGKAITGSKAAAIIQLLRGMGIDAPFLKRGY